MYNPIKKDEYPKEMTFQQIEELFTKIGAEMRCKNCRYWATDEDADMRSCENPLIMTEREGVYGNPFVYAGQDFGCIHWKGK